MTTGIDTVELVDGVAVKHHGGPDGAVRARRAAVAMRAAATAGLPVPPVRALDGPTLTTSAVGDAVSARALLGRRGEVVLGAIGAFARRLHRLPPPHALAGGSGTWVHGDLCPENVLVRGGTLVAVVDWEDSRADDPLVDLVWTEWLVRAFHPEATAALGTLYAAYGAAVAGAERRRAVMGHVLEHRLGREGPDASAALHRGLAALPALDLTLDAGHRPAG